VLRALATDADEDLRHGFLHVGRGGRGETLGLDLDGHQIHDAILTLLDMDYVEAQVQYESGPGASFTHLRVTGRGQQALGEWPLFDEIASPDTLALFLERLAEEAPTDEEESNLRRAAVYIRNLGVPALRALAVGAIAHAARAALNLP
jgi:hypothetical protein